MSDYRGPRGGLGKNLPRAARSALWLIGVNLGVWALMLIVLGFSPRYVRAMEWLALSPDSVLGGHLYQLATYMVLHDTRSPLHILMNMMLVYFFTTPLERRWGPWAVVRFALICGVGGGVMIMLFHLVAMLFGVASGSLTVGFSGAALGLLAAFCFLESESEVLLFFVLPIKAKHMLGLVVGIDAALWLFTNSDVSFPAHLGGIITGLLLVTGLWRPSRLKDRWTLMKLRRERKKRSAQGNVIKGPWVN